jgi:hypothetical protein
MSGKDDSGYGKKIEGLKEKLKELERQLENSFGGKWFKRGADAAPAATTQKQTSANADGELRMVLMGPPGAGAFPPLSPQHVALPAVMIFAGEGN